MWKLIERLKVKFLVRITWGISKQRLLDSLRLFSATEADSAWQLRYVAEKTTDPKLRAELFSQVLEEIHHAALFSDLYDQSSTRKLIPAKYERKAIYPAGTDLWKFYVYCFVGERDAATRFYDIYCNIQDGPLKETLRSILRDEAGHVHGAGEVVKSLGVTPEVFKKEIFKIRATRKWEAWLRAGRTITDGISTLLLSAVYYVIGPFCALLVRRKMDGVPVESLPKAPSVAIPLIALPVSRKGA